MNTDEKSSEKFMYGDKVRLRGTDRTGVVDGYEYYRGVRVWVREGNLVSAYHEDALELVEATHVVSSFKALTEAAEEGPDKAPSFRISRRMARGLLDYIAELEKAAEVPPKPELALGDLVEIIRPESAFQGRQGTIVNIETLAERYPYSVEIKSARMGSTNYGSSIGYYNIADLKKVSA